MFILYLIIGAISGIIGGMGMGGGTLLIPILTILFNVEQKVAQTINLISFIPMAIICLLIHMRNKLVRYKKSLFVIISGLVTCIVGCFVARGIETNILKKLFGVFLIILAVLQVVFSIKKSK